MPESRRAVVIVAPNSFRRFARPSPESQFQLLTRSGRIASLRNLERYLTKTSELDGVDSSLRDVNPMAGYYLESFVKSRGYDARVVFDWENDDALQDALRLDPIAVCLSTTYITDNVLLFRALRELRRAAQEIPLIVGGPYIWKRMLEYRQSRENTARGEMIPVESLRSRSLRAFDVDELSDSLFASRSTQAANAIFVASEFGEYTLLNLLRHIESGATKPSEFADVPNLALPGPGDAWTITRFHPESIDLENDFTRWDLVESVPPLLPMRASVGCPYKCRYCDFIQLHPRVLMRSTSSLLREIELGKARKRGCVNFVDDNIFLSKKRIAQLTGALLESGAHVKWGGFFRVDRIDESNIDALWNSGCRFGLCGIESGDSEMLMRMRKGCDVEQVQNGIQLATERGIGLTLTFIVGYPGENSRSVENTIQFMNSLQCRSHRGVASYQVYPFYLLASTAVDDPAYRQQFNLRGRNAHWSHATMNYEEAIDYWAPQVFRAVDSIPYDYYINDFPMGWSVDRRNRAYSARKALTVAFLDKQADDIVQTRFDDLRRQVVNGSSGESGDAPWSSFLADRDRQPGAEARRPWSQLGG